MNLAGSKKCERQLVTDHIFSRYFEKIATAISRIESVPLDIINNYRLEAKFRADMHNVSICARQDPEKTWILCNFQITKEEVEAIMTDWKDEWKHDVRLDEVSDSEDEDTKMKKKYEQQQEEEVVKEKKHAPKKTKTTMTKNKTTTETIEDPEDTTVPSMTLEMGKKKIVLGGGGSTPNKARGTPSKFPETDEQISLLEEKLNDHSLTIWEDIDSA